MRPRNDWQRIPCPPLPDPAGPIVLRIRPGECWCANCGEPHSGDAPPACCAKPAPVRVTEILWPEEYRPIN